MTIYNKRVRDRIPEITRGNGDVPGALPAVISCDTPRQSALAGTSCPDDPQIWSGGEVASKSARDVLWLVGGLPVDAIGSASPTVMKAELEAVDNDAFWEPIDLPDDRRSGEI